MRQLFLFICIFIATAAFSQKEKTVVAEYTYIAPETQSLEQAKRTALERAKVQAIADEFGTVVSETNVTRMENSGDRSNVDFMSVGGSEAKGEWIETIKEPEYDISYQDNMPVIKVRVKGRIREIIAAKIEYKARVLKNGTEDKFESRDFRNGDDLFVSFISPVAGYVAIYLVDDTNAFCLLPYQNQETGIYPVRANQRYVFFSEKDADPQERSLVDHLYMTCERAYEFNQIYVIFSPNEFTKAVDSQVTAGLPRQLGVEAFHKWMAKCRKQDPKMAPQPFDINLKK
jgi:hypothetical protein